MTFGLAGGCLGTCIAQRCSTQIMTLEGFAWSVCGNHQTFFPVPTSPGLAAKCWGCWTNAWLREIFCARANGLGFGNFVHGPFCNRPSNAVPAHATLQAKAGTCRSGGRLGAVPAASKRISTWAQAHSNRWAFHPTPCHCQHQHRVRRFSHYV